MPRISIDGKSYEVAAGNNLLHACLSLGLDVPYFCWHPAMGSVGACRQCAVKQFHGEDDQHGRLVMACMIAADDGTRISIADPEAVQFRARGIEWVMTNHPHDCPVCEEGGECHLQDMTMMTGHAYRRYRFKKRTHRNQYLGPFITHEMDRCIACYRCVRFYNDYVGGHDFGVFAAHNSVYFGRHEDGVLESEFSGNLAEVCPTGVFDDKTLAEFYDRKWDLRGTPSVCVHCGLGCSTTPNERYGKVRRILNRYNGEVNGYFLCDRGRFGYGFVNSDQRIREPLLRPSDNNAPEPAAKDVVLARLAKCLAGGRAIGIGSPRASLEANFALRELVGAEYFYLGLSDTEQELLALIVEILRRGPARSPSLKDAEQADAVLVLGEDVPDAAPRLALSLRQAVRRKAFEIAETLKIPHWQDGAVRDAAQQERSPLFIATPDATRLDDAAVRTFRAAPNDLARLGLAVAHELDAASPAVPGLPDDMGTLARDIAGALRQAKRPLVVAGTGCASAAVIKAAANVAWALCRDGRAAELCLTVPECNSLGLGLIGGHRLADAFQAVEDGAAEVVVVLENDLYRHAERTVVDRCLVRARHVVVLDHLPHDTARKAEIVLPAGTFAEADGTLVSNEGRAQRFFQLLVPEGTVQESWRWLRDALHVMGRPPEPPWARMDDVTAACAKALPALAAIQLAAPAADFRVNGAKISRESHRYSGRTSIHAAATVHEPKPPDDPDTP
ncbi:MAG: NADH-quinone oxidoreductase subunit NuoG, partial [Acetobacteraceae bacterium]